MTRTMLILAMLLTGCADRLYYPNGSLMAVGMSDRLDERIRWDGHTLAYSSTSALHSPVARTHWHGVALVASDAVAAGIGWKYGGKAADAVFATVPAATTSYSVTRPAPTPTPAPAVLQSKH